MKCQLNINHNHETTDYDIKIEVLAFSNTMKTEEF